MEKALSIGLLFLTFWQTHSARAQTQTLQKPEQLVDQWFVRLNALDDWRRSGDGKEENDAAVDQFVELYRPDAFHQVGPSEHQIGSVVFHGREGIRKWANDFSKSYVDLFYRVSYTTQDERTEQLVHVTRPPWGGTAASVEFLGAHTVRQDRKRIVVPGAVFFRFDDAGKIQNVRLYVLRDELGVISP